MSEEAAAAIDADTMKEKSGGPQSQSNGATNGYHHDMNGGADQQVDGDGVKEVDAARVAEKVSPAT